ncbi:MAG: dihydrolipoamide acetyltransferase family protein [Armatimonadota bacterium]
MPTEVIMPPIGESVAEGVIVKWLKHEGDTVQEDEPLVEVETDKAVVEVPSPASGVVARLLAQEGQPVEIEQPIAIIVREGEELPEAPEPAPPAAEQLEALAEELTEGLAAERHEPTEEPEEAPRRRVYSPLVQKLAAEHDVDLSLVTGTGIGGRVRKQDVLAFVEQPDAAAPTPAAPAPSAPAAPPARPEEADELVPLTGMRRAIADHMIRSKQTSAHVTTVAQVDMTRIVEWRERNRDDFEEREGARLTYMPFIIRATTDAIAQFPIMNSSMGEDSIAIKKSVHLGVAVAGPQGLLVPAIRHANHKSIPDLARILADVAARARDGKLKLDEVQGGTFSITNPGVYGAILSTPIINQPQAAILGVEAIQKMPVVINDAIAIRSMMYLCLSYDHRIVDGATAVQFLQAVRRNLEEFEFLR